MSIPKSQVAVQESLSIPLILTVSTCMTIVWGSLWYIKPNIMKRKQPQTLWQIFGYSTLLTLGVIGLYTESLGTIMFHISDIWSYPLIHRRLTRLYFELEITWYVHSFVCTLINREAKDFWVMLFHHSVTPFEVYYAYECGYGAIGLYIMFLHDAGDVPLHIAKSFHNCNWSKATDIAFFIFTVIFAWTRLILLPMCPAAYFFFNTENQSTCGHALAYTCVILCCLHLYWFYLIIVLIKRFVAKGRVEGDIREKDIEQRMLKDIEQEKLRKSKMNGHHIDTSYLQKIKKDIAINAEPVSVEGEEFTPEIALLNGDSTPRTNGKLSKRKAPASEKKLKK